MGTGVAQKTIQELNTRQSDLLQVISSVIADNFVSEKELADHIKKESLAFYNFRYGNSPNNDIGVPQLLESDLKALREHRDVLEMYPRKYKLRNKGK
jgi:hypothetical protein